MVLLSNGRLEAASSPRRWSTLFSVDPRRTHVVPAGGAYLPDLGVVEHQVGGRILRTLHVSSKTGDDARAGTPSHHDEWLSIIDVTKASSSRETIPARLHDCSGLGFVCGRSCNDERHRRSGGALARRVRTCSIHSCTPITLHVAK
jgi:hypothetical protein